MPWTHFDRMALMLTCLVNSHIKHCTVLLATKQSFTSTRAENELLGRIKSRKLHYFMDRRLDSIENRMTTGLIYRFRKCGRRRKCWLDNIMAQTGLSGTILLSATRYRRHCTALSYTCGLETNRNLRQTAKCPLKWFRIVFHSLHY